MPLETYKKIERGRIPQSGTLAQICKRLGVSEADLFWDRDDPPTLPAKQRLIQTILSPTFDDLDAQAILSSMEAMRNSANLPPRHHGNQGGKGGKKP